MKSAPVVKSKLPNASTTIFTVMSQLANEHQAINLSQGFPDFEVDPRLIELVSESMKEGFNQYAPMAGLMSLREQIALKASKGYSADYDPEHEITITAGATQAIFTAIAAVVAEGDEVILFTPAYDCYGPAVELMGGKPKYIALKQPDYHIDWTEVRKIVSRHTKLIIINTPHNPTGSILSAYDLQMLEKITRGTDILVLSDEVYAHQIFDGYEHQSVARFPNLSDRSFIVGSFGKTLNVTGWKIGYCIAPKNLTVEFRKAHQFNVFAVNHPMQVALAKYMQQGFDFSEISGQYQQRRDFFLSALKGSRFKFSAAAGSYFQILNYSAITDEGDVQFARHLTINHKIASIPLSVFYNIPTDHKVLRFCFAKKLETLEKAAEILCKI